jgi:hypothetical protein
MANAVRTATRTSPHPQSRSIPKYSRSHAESSGSVQLMVVAATLGASLNDALNITFHAKLADSSLRLFSMHDVPAIRGHLPAGISDVHFRSDLSAVQVLLVQSLIDQDPVFWDLLPHESEN